MSKRNLLFLIFCTIQLIDSVSLKNDPVKHFKSKINKFKSTLKWQEFLPNYFTYHVNCRRIEDEVYLRTISDEDDVLKFYNTDLNAYRKVIDYILLNRTKQMSSDCEDSLVSIKYGMANSEDWSLKYIESNGRFKNGFLRGRQHDLGDFDLCLSIEAKEIDEKSFSGKFCLASFNSPAYVKEINEEMIYKTIQNSLSNRSRSMLDLSMGIIIGFCIPSTCETQEILSSVNKIMNDYQFDVILSNQCYTGYKLDYKFLIALSILAIIAGLCLSTLIFDHKLLRPFSLKHNLSYVYREETGKDDVSFIYGFRFFYLILSISANLLGFYVTGIAPFMSAGIKSINLSVLRPFADRVILLVDAMFFLSGFQIFQSVYDNVENKKSNIIKILLRWPIFLFPGYLIYICCLIVLSSLSVGTYVELSTHFLDACRANGWKLITFTSNTNHFLDQCIITSWFNSINLQLSLLHYVLLFIFIKNQSTGLIVSILILFISTLFEAYRMINENIPAYFTITKDSMFAFLDIEKDLFHFTSHIQPFTIGFLCGYAFKHDKVSWLKKSMIAYLFLIISTVCYFGSFLFPELFELGILPKNQILLICYFAFKRIAFVLLFATCFLLFRIDRLGFLKQILFFSTLQKSVSKLASSLIICQYLYFIWALSTATEIVKFSIRNVFRDVLYSLINIFIMSNIFYLLFEAPLVNLLKEYIINRINRATVINFEVNNNNNECINKTDSHPNIYLNRLGPHSVTGE